MEAQEDAMAVVSSRSDNARAPGAARLADLCLLTPMEACRALESTPPGLPEDEAARRLQRFGPNLVGHERPPTMLGELWGRARNPLNALLLALAATSWLLGDLRSAIVIGVIVLLAVGLAFIQEHRSNRAAQHLRRMVHTTASVRRAGADFVDIPLDRVVPGDVVRLSAGDMIPGDLRLLEAKDLFVNQSALSGEAMPVEKSAAPSTPPGGAFDLPNVCFMGTNVVSGFAIGVVAGTGPRTAWGRLAHDILGARDATAFDRGVDRFTWLMVRFMAVMVPAVFLINGFTKHDWLEALLFAVAVGVGLTPEMLPMIVTVNLAKGAIALSRLKVIVKRLNAIQDFGAMDVLCTDKTGTLTQDRIILKRHLDMRGEESDRVLHVAWLNSHFQSGLRNLLDTAVLSHVELQRTHGMEAGYAKVDEIPFDFSRRRLSVVVSRPDGRHLLICKGAVEEIFAVCTRYEAGDESGSLDESHFRAAQEQTRALNEDGFRVVAVAYREFDKPRHAYGVADEAGLTLLGYIAFLDPPKESARQALAALAAKGVAVKVVTGDNEVITRKICREVGLEPGEIVTGARVASLDDAALAELASRTRVFAKITPDQKARIVRTLSERGHVVGFLGDGINDSPALKAADVGISVDTAVDIAKESADIILLEKSLLVLHEGVVEGRRIFANIVKYIRMGASSNFGNMFSVLGASLFLPFLPMAPLQILTNNLLYDFSQTAIPTDQVDAEYLTAPRRWDIDNLFRFMLFVGPISSVFDYATFALMLTVFDAWSNPALFQTGWFVESLLTQTLIIHVIRTARVPFVQSHASPALIATTLAVCAAGIALPYSVLGPALGFVPLPWVYWPALAVLLLAYCALAHAVKAWFVRRWGL